MMKIYTWVHIYRTPLNFKLTRFLSNIIKQFFSLIRIDLVSLCKRFIIQFCSLRKIKTWTHTEQIFPIFINLWFNRKFRFMMINSINFWLSSLGILLLCHIRCQSWLKERCTCNWLLSNYYRWFLHFGFHWYTLLYYKPIDSRYLMRYRLKWSYSGPLWWKLLIKVLVHLVV